MEREVSSVARLAVMLVSIAALLGIVWVTLVMGNRLKFGAYEEAAMMQTNIEQTQIKSVCDKDKIIIPKAAIYNLVAQSSSSISYMEYTDSDGMLTIVKPGNKYWEAEGSLAGNYLAIEDVLEGEMTGKAKLLVEKDGKGTYKVTIQAVGNLGG